MLEGRPQIQWLLFFAQGVVQIIFVKKQYFPIYNSILVLTKKKKIVFWLLILIWCCFFGLELEIGCYCSPRSLLFFFYFSERVLLFLLLVSWCLYVSYTYQSVSLLYLLACKKLFSISYISNFLPMLYTWKLNFLY